MNTAIVRKGVVISALALLLGWVGTVRAGEAVFWSTEVEPSRQALIQYLADVFHAYHPEHTIRPAAFEEGRIAEYLHAAVNAGTPPALVSMPGELAGSLALEDLLDPAAANSLVDAIGRGRFRLAALAALANPGQGQFGVPFHGWIQGIWYRSDWFQEANLPPPDTPARLLAAARHFTDPAAKRFGIVLGTSADLYTEQCFAPLARAMGARLFDEDGHLAIDEPAMIEAVATYRDLARFAPPVETDWRARDYFLQGHAAMMVYSTFIMDDLAIESAAADSLKGGHFSDLAGAPFDPNLVNRVAMAPKISGVRDSAYGSIEALSFPRGSSDSAHAAALAFARFLFQPDVYVTWLHMAPGGMLPMVDGVVDSDRFLRDPLSVFPRYGRDKIRSIVAGFDDIDGFSRDSSGRYPFAALIYADKIIPRMLRAVLWDNVEPAAAVARAAREAEALLAARGSNRP